MELKKGGGLCIALTALFLLGLVGSSHAIPPQPQNYFGFATEAGGAALDGYSVGVKLNDDTEFALIQDGNNPGAGFGTSVTSLQNGYYDMNLKMDDPDTGEVEGAQPGDVVHFFVEGEAPNTTPEGPFTVVPGGSVQVDLSLPDVFGPTTSDVRAAGSLTSVDIPEGTTSLELTAFVSDIGRGGSNIAAAEYFVNQAGAGGTGTAMSAQSGAFDSPEEDVTAQVDTSAWTEADSPYTLFVQGQDSEGNWGDSASVVVTVFLAPPSTIELVSGNSQSGVVVSNLPLPLVVKVTDDFGFAKQGVTVDFSEQSGAGSFNPVSTQTGADGTASTIYTLGTLAGANQVIATSSGLTGSPIMFNATGTPGPLNKLVVAIIDAVTAGDSNEVMVTAVDEYDNTVTGFTGTVTLTSSDTNATLPGPYAYQPGDNGSHIFTGVILTTAADNQTVTAATNGISNFDDVTVNPAAASKVGLVADEMVLASDQKGSSNLTATLLDPFDNTVPTTGTTVNLVISDDTYVVLDNDAPNTTDGVALATLTTKAGTVTDPPKATNVTATSAGLADSAPVEFALVNFSIDVIAPGAPFYDPATGVHLVTSDSTPYTAVFAGVGDESGNYRWALASCGSISSETADEIVYTAPLTIDGTSCMDTLTLTSAANEALEETVDIFIYNPVEFTWPTEPAGIALGDESYGVTASGGTGAYTFNGTEDAVATVDETTGAITPVAVGVFNAEVIDEEFGDFDENNGYFDESAEIEICEAIVITPTPPTNTLLSEETWDFGATGACDSGEVDWEASDGEIDADGNYTAPAVAAGESVQVTITAYDKTYNADSYTPIKTEYTLTVNGPLSIVNEQGVEQGDQILSGETVEFKGMGGDGNYFYSVAGPVPVDGGTGETYDFTAPSDGAYAGVYTITVTDGADFMDEFVVRVPFTATPETFSMLEGETLDLSIMGAPEGTTFTVTQYDSRGDEIMEGTFEFVDEPTSPEQMVRYNAPDDLAETLAFTAMWEATTQDGSLEDAGLDQVTSGFYTVIPVDSFAGAFEDEMGSALTGVTVEITAPSSWQAITNTNDSGATDSDFAFNLPVSGTTYWFRASKAGYVTTAFTSADLAGETAEDNVIVLEAAGIDAYISGTVTKEGGEPDGPVDVIAYFDDDGVLTLAGIATAASPFRFDFEADNSPYTVTASIPGFFDEAGVDELPDSSVALNLLPNAGAECITNPVAGGKVADDGIFVEVPFGSVDTSLGDDPFCFDLDTDADMWACGRGSGDVIYQIDADVTFVGDIIITLPFDLTLVPPGGFESGDFAVWQADDLGECENVETIPRNQIVAVDYVGDGFIGEVTFLASHLSDFGISVGDEDDDACLNCNKDDDRCFIATAAYGSPFEKHVKVLRQFRNAYLLPTKVGRAFVNAYYSLSPGAADFIANHDTLRALTRTALLPFVGMSYLMLHIGFFGTMLALASALLVCLGLWKMGHGRMRKAALLAVPLLLAVLMVVGSAEARQKKGWYGAGYGVFALENLDTDDTKKKLNCPASVDFDDSWGVQARAGYTYNEYFQLEGMYEYIAPFKADKGPLDDELDVMHFSVNGKFTCPVYDAFVPYAIVGIGALTTYEDLKYKDGLSRNCKESNWGFGARVGLGFDYYFNPMWALGFEGAYVFGTGDVDTARYGSFALGLGYHW